MKLLPILLCLGVLSWSTDMAGAKPASTPTPKVKAAKGPDSISACRDLVWEKSDDGDVSMRGVSQITVALPQNHPMLPDINFETIRTAVETKCRDAGLKTTNDQNQKIPALTITINPIGTGPKGSEPKGTEVVWVIDVDLFERSLLAKDMKTRSLTRVYGHQRLKCIGELRVGQSELHADVLDSVDAFINAWRRDNHR